jgi:hypothetical protein
LLQFSGGRHLTTYRESKARRNLLHLGLLEQNANRYRSPACGCEIAPLVDSERFVARFDSVPKFVRVQE